MTEIEYQRNGRIETIERDEAHRTDNELLVAYDNTTGPGVGRKIRLPIERVVAVHD